MENDLKTQLDTMNRKELDDLCIRLTLVSPATKDLSDDELRDLLLNCLKGSI